MVVVVVVVVVILTVATRRHQSPRPQLLVYLLSVFGCLSAPPVTQQIDRNDAPFLLLLPRRPLACLLACLYYLPPQVNLCDDKFAAARQETQARREPQMMIIVTRLPDSTSNELALVALHLLGRRRGRPKKARLLCVASQHGKKQRRQPAALNRPLNCCGQWSLSLSQWPRWSALPTQCQPAR